MGYARAATFHGESGDPNQQTALRRLRLNGRTRLAAQQQRLARRHLETAHLGMGMAGEALLRQQRSHLSLEKLKRIRGACRQGQNQDQAKQNSHKSQLWQVYINPEWTATAQIPGYLVAVNALLAFIADPTAGVEPPASRWSDGDGAQGPYPNGETRRYTTQFGAS